MAGANVPKLRFPEFSGEWEVSTLEDVAKVDRGKFSIRPRNDPRYFGGDMPFVQTGDIAKANLYLEEFSQTLNSDGIKVSRVFPKNTILMTIAANIGDVAISKFSVACPDSLVGIYTNQKANTYFVYYALGNSKEELLSKATTNAQANINLQILNPLKINLPTLPEQTKIAEFLGVVDEKIKVLRQKHGLLKDYKRGVMQKIFTQQIRFKKDDGTTFPDWEEKKLGDLLDYEQPTSYIVESTEYSDTFETPVLTAGKSFILGYTNEKFGVYKNTLPVIIFDDFTTSSQFVDFQFKVKSSAMKILKLRSQVDSIKLIFEVLKTIDYDASDHKRHWISVFQDIEIPYPHPDEQQKIADFLSSIDNKIDATQSQIDQMTQFKKGLLQQMFV